MGEEEILHVLADKNTIYRFEMENSFHFLEDVLFCLVLLKIFSHLYFADQTCHCRLQKNKNGGISHKDTVKAFQGKNTRWVLKLKDVPQNIFAAMEEIFFQRIGLPLSLGSSPFSSSSSSSFETQAWYQQIQISSSD